MITKAFLPLRISTTKDRFVSESLPSHVVRQIPKVMDERTGCHPLISGGSPYVHSWRAIDKKTAISTVEFKNDYKITFKEN